jgi:DNA-nicking Smr family endonuclease
MGRRHKKGHDGDATPAAGKPKPAPEATTSLGALFKAASIDKVVPARTPNKPQPPPPLPPKVLTPREAPGSATELRLLNDAYAGARPLPRKNARHVVSRPLHSRVTQEEREAEAAARKRLAALVAGGVHFKVRREDEFVEAWRSEASSKAVAKLSGKGFTPEATLDLHGERAARVSDVVATFVRTHHRRGARHLLIIVGKGLHSEDGVGVLLEALIEALTHGLAAPLVRGFASANALHGGTGAVAVLLI